MTLQPSILQEIVDRTVKAVHPIRIILFGSAAADQLGPDSDLDLLIVMPDGVHRRKTAQLLYQSLYGVGFAKDLVVATLSDLKRHATNPGLVYAEALRTGRELYHAS